MKLVIVKGSWGLEQPNSDVWVRVFEKTHEAIVITLDSDDVREAPRLVSDEVPCAIIVLSLEAEVDLVKAIRAECPRAVIVHIGPSSSMHEKVLKAGANYYLNKNVTAELIHTVVLRQMSWLDWQPATTTRMGAVEVDPELHLVYVGKTPVKLTRQQWVLFSHLLSKQGRPVTTTELYNKLGVNRTNQVAVLANHIRARFREAGLEQPIPIIPKGANGEGYSVNMDVLK